MRGVLCGLLQEGAQDRKHGIPRIAGLQATPASMRLLSIEPLLENLGTIDLQGISWVIVGGESGPGARPMKEGWVLSILEQCAAARIPFSFKQWGGVRKKATGRKLLGRTYDEFPKRVQHPMLPTRRRVRHISKMEDKTRLAHQLRRCYSLLDRSPTVGVPTEVSTAADLGRNGFRSAAHPCKTPRSGVGRRPRAAPSKPPASQMTATPALFPTQSDTIVAV